MCFQKSNILLTFGSLNLRMQITPKIQSIVPCPKIYKNFIPQLLRYLVDIHQLNNQAVFSEIIAHIAHLSFLEGRFTATFKHASVTPLLKGHALDKSVPSNYMPISNLNFISKVLERLFLSRFQAHILASLNFNQYQSAYRPGCSTETALQLLLDRIYSQSDEGKPTLLISLDLSSAFDVIDHVILLNELYRDLENWLRGLSRSLKLMQFKSLGAVSYSPSIQ